MAMHIPEETITQITERLDIVELVGEYTALSRKGGRYWGLCPFHTEKTPSFSVTPEKGVFYCFGCHKGGSVLNFIMEIEKLSFPEAVAFAAKKTGIEITSADDRSGDLRRDALLELLSRVTRSFSHFLRKHEMGERARRYLLERKIGEDIQDQFGLGYAPPETEWLYGFLKTKNYSDDFLNRSGLFSRGRQAYFRHRLMFPIMNTRGEIIAFGGRALDDRGGPKYLNSPETSFFRKGGNLYGISHALSSIKEKGFCYIVEGYTDVLALHAAGVPNCVAPLGTALTESQVKLLKRYCGKVVLLFDADQAGINATVRAIEIVERAGLEAEVAELAGQKDPAEIFEKDGGRELKKVIEYTINSFHYLLKKAMTQNDVATPGGKEGVVAFIAPVLESVQSAVRRDAYCEEAAEVLGVRVETVQNDLRRLRQPGRRQPRPESEMGPRQLSDELFFMLATAIAGDAFPAVRKDIRLEELSDPSAKELYIALEECFRHDEDGMEKLLQRCENADLRSLVLEKASSDEFSLNREKLIADGIRSIRQKSLERKKSDVLKRLHAYEKQKTDFALIRDLQLEIMYLDEELKKLKVREHGRDN